MEKETHLKTAVNNLSAMLRTVRSLNKGTDMAEVAGALEKHLKGLTLADLGLVELAPAEVPQRVAEPVRPATPSALAA